MGQAASRAVRMLQISRSLAEKTALQECLHVTAAVRDYRDENFLADDVVNRSIGLHQELTEFTNPDRLEFFGNTSTQRIVLQRLYSHQEHVQKLAGLVD